MISLQLDLSQTQAEALFHLVIQLPAHSVRECASDDDEAHAMRQSLEAIRAALTAQGLKAPQTPSVQSAP